MTTPSFDSAQDVPLLTTKLYIPPPRPNLVSRPRLIERLDAGLNRKLTLVSAPAGFGKTTLLSEWAAGCERSVAWLSLDEGDDDPARFLAYFITALQTIHKGVGDVALTTLRSPQPPPIEAILTTLINEIATIPNSLIFILDDYHAINAQPIHDALTFLLDHLPPQIRLVVASRTDPPLPLARLRGRGQLAELHVANLHFTPKETAAFLNGVMGLDVSPEDVATLEDRTEGWIAGLQMAAVSMRGRKDVSAFIRAFTGSHRFILDYLVEEVLEQQPRDVQEFLLKTSILERMTGALCDAVTDGNDGQTILAQLEQANLFLVPLDDRRRWYRYHHLFGDLLKSTLRQRKSAEEIRELHRRASRWHQGECSLKEAMIHAMAAQDFERAASMIEENIASMLSCSEAPILLGWIEKLPEQIALGRPWVDIYRAYTLALSGLPDEADPLLEDAEQRIDPDTPRASEFLGHIAAIRSYIANLRGDADRVIEMAVLAEKHLPKEHLVARGMTTYALTATYFADDDMESSIRASLKMLEIGKALDRLLMIVTGLCDLASTKKVQGRLCQAEEHYERARQWMVERNGLDSRLRSPYEIGLADLLREWNQLDAAHEHAATGIEYCQRFGVPSELVSGYLTLMRILQAQGDVEGALDALRNAEQTLQTHHIRLAMRIAFRTARVVQWLAVGDVETASRWAEECGGGSELEQIALARLRLAQGRAADALRLLDRQRALAEAGGRAGRLIEIMGLQALALEAQAQPDEAKATLSQALSLARPEGHIRVFLDLGWPLCELLERSAARGAATRTHGAAAARITREYVRELLDAFRQEREAQGDPSTSSGQALAKAVSLTPALAEALIDPLTEREMEVLQLLAEGRSNKEIAGRLVVAPSTVKQHLKSIYGKLDVHSRTQAVARGRALGLL